MRRILFLGLFGVLHCHSVTGRTQALAIPGASRIVPVGLKLYRIDAEPVYFYPKDEPFEIAPGPHSFIVKRNISLVWSRSSIYGDDVKIISGNVEKGKDYFLCPKIDFHMWSWWPTLLPINPKGSGADPPPDCFGYSSLQRKTANLRNPESLVNLNILYHNFFPFGESSVSEKKFLQYLTKASGLIRSLQLEGKCVALITSPDLSGGLSTSEHTNGDARARFFQRAFTRLGPSMGIDLKLMVFEGSSKPGPHGAHPVRNYFQLFHVSRDSCSAR